MGRLWVGARAREVRRGEKVKLRWRSAAAWQVEIIAARLNGVETWHAVAAASSVFACLLTAGWGPDHLDRSL